MKESIEPEGSTLTGSTPWDSSWPKYADDHERRLLFSYLEDRFGIQEEVFADFDLFSRSKSWWLLRKRRAVNLPVKLKVNQVGLRAFDRVGRYLKPANYMVQVFGHHATRGVYRFTDTELEKLLKAEPLEVKTEMEDGFVILRFREHVLGIGLLMKGTITSRIKKTESERMIGQ